jgi:imidazolonepropionase-like amidohydrolase
MSTLAIVNAQIFDGTGRDVFPGTVLVEGNRISQVMPRAESVVPDGVECLDAAGRFAMPGLIEGHAHPSFLDVSRQQALGEMPPEDHAIDTLLAAQQLLMCGFTSLCSAAAAKIRLDVATRDSINSGRTWGPRLLAASPEITVTGGLGDARQLHQHMDSFGLIADGADAMRAAVRLCLREGVDTIKLNISGDQGVENALADQTVMTDAEIAAATETAHAAGRRVAAHARASESVKRALRHGVDIIYHCDFADEEALDQLEQARDTVFTGPAIGIVIQRLKSLQSDTSVKGAVLRGRLQAVFEASCHAHNEMRKRGVRIVPGGDYGFAVNPQGTNARDLQHFVDHFGFSRSEALVAATRTGGEIMLMPEELGILAPGYLADLIVVDGNPLTDLEVLVGPTHLDLIMLDGKVMHRAATL